MRLSDAVPNITRDSGDIIDNGEPAMTEDSLGDYEGSLGH
jgi:hypothetical protein